MKLVFDILYSLGLTPQPDFIPTKPRTFAPKVGEADSFTRAAWKSVVQSANRPWPASPRHNPRKNIPKIEVVSSLCQKEPVLFFTGRPSIVKINTDFVQLPEASKLSILKGLDFAVETENYQTGFSFGSGRFDGPPIFDHQRMDVRKQLMTNAETAGECVTSVAFRQWCQRQAEQPEPELDFC